MFRRQLQKNIENWLFKGQIIILYGARQVGKTTLVKEIKKKYSNECLYLNCDELQVREKLKPTSFIELKNYIGEPKILIIDEAQRVENIGLILKIFHDSSPKTQIIATGSSSFSLANRISEPLTGRSIDFILYPLSLKEIAVNKIDAKKHLSRFLLYGSYPNIYKHNEEDAALLLQKIASQYLYKDLLGYENLKKPQLLIKLLQLLAWQIGNEVSTNELSKTLQVDKSTIERYLDLLEKSFVIFRLSSFSKNLRKEIRKSKKFYFYDLGIRNTIINSFGLLDYRADIGGIWENFCVVERLKQNEYQNRIVQSFFWRNYSKEEIDYLEIKDDAYNAWEFKWNERRKMRYPKSFKENYPNSNIEIINNNNFLGFIE